MPTILVILASLAGFVACFALSNLLTWNRDEQDHSARYFGLVCLGFAAYVVLQLSILTSRDLASAALWLRWQGAATAFVFASLVRFGAVFARRPIDRLDWVFIALYASLGVWSLASPAGYWFSSLSALEPVVTAQGTLHHPRGSFAWTYYVSIVVQYPLLIRQILDGRRTIISGSRVDGWIWVLCIAFVLLGGTHDHLVDFGLLTPPYLVEYPFPLAMLAMGTRYAQRRSREFARLHQLQAALTASEAKLRELYESSSDAIFVHDASTGAIIDVNRTMCEMYGYTREESLALSVGDLSANSEKYSEERARERLAEAQQLGVTTFAWQARRKDGSPFPVEVTLKCTELGGKTCIVGNVRDHTERRATTEALAQEKEFVTTLLDSLPGTFYLYDGDLKLKRWNRNLELSLGYSAEQLGQMTMMDWYPPGTERDELIAAMLHWFAHGQGNVQRETTVLRADGSKVPYLITATRLNTADGMMLMGVGLDISAFVQAQEDLREGEERYRTLFDSAGDAILLMREDRFIDCNASALKVYGCTGREQLVNHSPQEFSPERQPDNEASTAAALSRITAALSGTPQQFEWLHRRVDGTTFVAEVSLNRVDLRGARHLQAIVRDVTERRRLEERLQQAQRLEAIGHLAGGVAHDFNNLLTPIVGHVELLLEELSASDPARDDLEQILSAAHRARRLTQQLLTVGRKGVLDVQAVDICALVLGMKGLLASLLREDIELEVDVEPNGAIVTADPSQLEQVVMNLVVNARDAMPRGGRLQVAVSRCELGAAFCPARGDCAHGEHARLSVSDTGIGMTEEVKRRLFEPFFTTKTLGRGTGLGLATVFGIVQQHRGTLAVTSEPDLGSTLCVCLPIVNEPVLLDRAASVAEPAIDGTETVLVVEDDSLVRAFTCRALERHGYVIHVAESAEQALGLFTELTKPPQLVVTDVVLPKLNGRELFERLRIQRPDLRVLYMSGYSGDTISHHGILNEGVVLIQKPFTVEQLLSKVRAALDA